MPRILAFYIGYHDSNAVIADTDINAFKYFKAERLLGVKRARADLGFVNAVCERAKFTPDVIAYSDGNRNLLGECGRDQVIERCGSSPCNLFSAATWYVVDHHFAHAMSVWPVCPVDQVDTAIVVDGMGDHGRRVSVFKSPSEFGAATFNSDALQIGHLFDCLGQRLGFGGHLADHAGKLMGLQAFGHPSAEHYALLETQGFRSNMLAYVDRHWKEKGIGFFDWKSQEFRDWLACVHQACSDAVCDLFKEQCTSEERIFFSGGCSMNTVFNTSLQQQFPNLVLSPHGYDGGLSLGIFEATRRTLGLGPVDAKGFPYCQADEDFGYATIGTIERTASLLAKNRIVGWLQGCGEIGPRSLGHRSILMNPSIPDGKELINSIKRREHWRPFAPSILASCQRRYVDVPYSMPYMLHSPQALRSHMEEITACVHIDGTSRIQTIPDRPSEELESFRSLIGSFSTFTGIPGLLNTSYNAAGKPIVSSRAEAIDFFNSSGLDAVVLGDELLTK